MAIKFQADEIVRLVTTDVKKARELIATQFIKDIVPATPVRTGHARRNWQVNWGSPNGQELPGVDRAGQNTVQNGLTRIKIGRNRNPFIPVVIENNVPYIGRLNEGSSRQAPPMFVEITLRRAINTQLSRISGIIS